MNVAVATLPSSDGRNVRGPTARLTIATTPTMTTSRLMTSTVSQSGTMVGQRDLRQREHDERRDEQQLVGHRIEPGAEAGRWPVTARDQAVERVGDAGNAEDDQRGAEVAVHRQQDERRNQHDPQNRQLVGQREVPHARQRDVVAAPGADRSPRWPRRPTPAARCRSVPRRGAA